jgi:hypothetical protein
LRAGMQSHSSALRRPHRVRFGDCVTCKTLDH